MTDRLLDGSFDCIVVGSGPGGATVARQLSRAGARVLIVERGDGMVRTGRVGQALWELWMPGRSAWLSGSVLVMRGVTVGGSSMYFFGTAWPPPFEALEPFGLDLRADVEQLRAELRPAPLPRELMGRRAVILMDSARHLGFEWHPIPKFFDQAAMAGRPGQAPVLDARWTARRFLDQAVASGAGLVTGARVGRVVTGNGAVRGVEVVHEGRRRTVAAGLVILAAGGLGTPMILRASGIERAGRDYFYDPVTTLIGFLDGLDAGPEPSMVAGFHNDRAGYMLSDISRPEWAHRLLTLAGGRPDRLAGYGRTLAVMVKARDELSGVMTRHGGPGKPLTGADRARLRQGEVDARAVLIHAGARRIYRTGYTAVHPGGTVKVGDLVDENLRTEISGLYVCDASVIPIAWGLPPTFTVMALGHRLARHLAGRAATASTVPS